MINSFKGLDLIERLKVGGWRLEVCGWRFVTLYRKQGSRPSPRKRNAKTQNDCPRNPYKKLSKKKKEAKGKGEKERYTHLNAEFQRIAR